MNNTIVVKGDKENLSGEIHISRYISDLKPYSIMLTHLDPRLPTDHLGLFLSKRELRSLIKKLSMMLDK